MFSPSIRISPVSRVPGIRSFIRFSNLKKVDLPQPDGPMNAVTVLRSISIVMFFSAWKSP